MDPLLVLLISLILVTFSLCVMAIVAIPAFQELARAARSAEKLFDLLGREFPQTLQAIRRTGTEIGHLSEGLQDGVKSAAEVVKQVDQGLSSARHQARNVRISSVSVASGIRAAWRSFRRSRRPRPISHRSRKSRSDRP